MMPVCSGTNNDAQACPDDAYHYIGSTGHARMMQIIVEDNNLMTDVSGLDYGWSAFP